MIKSRCLDCNEFPVDAGIADFNKPAIDVDPVDYSRRFHEDKTSPVSSTDNPLPLRLSHAFGRSFDDHLVIR
jgi:hypothetical protein